MLSKSAKASSLKGTAPFNCVDLTSPERALILNNNGSRTHPDIRGTDDGRAELPEKEIDLEDGDGKRKSSSIIPRSKRRGLFAQFVIRIPEIEDPVQYSPRTKDFLVFIIATAAMAAPMGCDRCFLS